MVLPSLTIHQIHIAPAGLINAFVVESQDHCMLIDCGLPGTENKVIAALERIGRKVSDISLIIVTHAHIDHAGNAARIRALSGAPILAHYNDLPYFSGEKAMTFCTTGWFGWAFKQTGVIQKPYTPFEPEILLKNGEQFDLAAYGIDGSVIPTPGHTEGSVSVLLKSGKAIVGDLISSGILLGGLMCKGRAKRPPFEDNPHAVAEALTSLSNNGAEIFYMGHGGPLPQKEVLRHARALTKIKSTQHSSSDIDSPRTILPDN